MSEKKKQSSDEAGNVDWDALAAEDNPVEEVEEIDPARLEEAKSALSEEDKSSPYSDDFLADWNLLLEDIEEEDQEDSEEE
ncbi:hypothetical protein [Algivirga pacifica]